MCILGSGYGPGGLSNSGSGSSSQASSKTSSFNNVGDGASNTGAIASASTNAQIYNPLGKNCCKMRAKFQILHQNIHSFHLLWYRIWWIWWS